MNDNIKMINRKLLMPHPDNPRKDLGDLKELADSIAEHGIMQNLTVVPEGNMYKILIGHRRFAASEGVLDELPCVVVNNLTYAQQVGVMLAENMQRADLTYIEQAHGFQLMLDLGDTVETIAEKTGFSKATVKHRLAINELDPEALKEVNKYFQPTISDFIALEKVKDVKKRNEILNDASNSRDIQDAVEDYIEEVQEQEDFSYYKKIFEAAGWIDETEKNQWFYYQDGFKPVDGALNRLELKDKTLIPEASVKKLMEKIKGEVHFSLCHHCIMVRTYKEPKGKQAEDDREKKRKAAEALRKKNKAALRQIRGQICDAYMDFILNSEVELKDPKEELGYFYVLMDLCREETVTIYSLTSDNVEYQIRDKVSEKGYDTAEKNPFKDFDNWTPLFQLLANIWWSFASSYNHFEDYDCKPKMERLKSHQMLCKLLSDLGGFHIKPEWKPILDGTSELYIQEDKQ